MMLVPGPPMPKGWKPRQKFRPVPECGRPNGGSGVWLTGDSRAKPSQQSYKKLGSLRSVANPHWTPHVTPHIGGSIGVGIG